jgi:hypothetical protein
VATGNTAIYANASLFDLVFNRYVTAHPHALYADLDLEALNTAFVIRTPGQIATHLLAQENGGNFGMDIPMTLDIITLDSGDVKSVAVNIKVSATLALNGQSLVLSNVTATGDDILNTKAAKLFTEKVVPQVQQMLSKVTLPDLTKVLGVSATVVGMQVAGGQVVVTGQVGDGSGSVNVPTILPAFPAVTATLCGDAINALAQTKAFSKIFPLTASTGAHSDNWWAGYDASASAWAGNPHVSVNGGQASGTIDVSFSAKGGIEALGQWVEPSINVSPSVPPMNLRLVTDGSGKNVNVQFSLDGTVIPNYDIPDALKSVASPIVNTINSIGSAITGKINDALSSVDINAFTLPATVPGTSIPADLTFDAVGFSGNSAVGVVRVN